MKPSVWCLWVPDSDEVIKLFVHFKGLGGGCHLRGILLKSAALPTLFTVRICKRKLELCARIHSLISTRINVQLLVRCLVGCRRGTTYRMSLREALECLVEHSRQRRVLSVSGLCVWHAESRVYKGVVVAPHVPRTEGGLYWGYSVRLASCLSE